MATKLKDLKITSTDLVEQGANQDAKIRLFKRKESPDGADIPETPPVTAETLLQKCINAITGVFSKPEPASIAKKAETFDDKIVREQMREVSSQIWDYIYAMSDSLSSILFDNDLDADQKSSTMFTSLDEFTESLRSAIPNWAKGEKADSNGSSKIEKSAGQMAVLNELWEKYTKSGEGAPPVDGAASVEESPIIKQKEETDTMKIDKSKMTAEEQATLAEFEKNYGIVEEDAPPASPADDSVAKGAEPPKEGAGVEIMPELHPEVKKALDENKELAARVEELQKSLEIKDLAAIAKKYEIIGKKPDELAPKLYDLKKAGGTAYDDFVGLLDEQVTMVEKGGLFSELGTSRSGAAGTDTELGAKVSELKKSNAEMSTPEAIVKAFEENPELAAQYEKEYMGRA